MRHIYNNDVISTKAEKSLRIVNILFPRVVNVFAGIPLPVSTGIGMTNIHKLSED